MDNFSSLETNKTDEEIVVTDVEGTLAEEPTFAPAVTTGSKSSFWKKKSTKQYFGLVWILPALAMLCIFCLYPTVLAFVNSLTDWDGGNVRNFIWFANYSELFADTIFWRSMLNVIILTVVGMVIGNMASLVLAELLYNMRSKLTAVYRFLFVLPAMIPGIITMLLWQKLILSGQSSGFMNIMLGWFGIESQEWFASQSTAIVFLSIFLYGFPWMGGTSFLIYLAGLNGIDESVVEASRLDGLGTFKRIFVIDLPLIKGQLKYFLVMGIIGGLQNYSMQYAITNGGPEPVIELGINKGTMVPGYYMYEMLFGGPDRYGYACAMGVVMFLIILVITIVNNTLLKSEE